MFYHNITTDDMLNGAGLRTVLWVSGCDHHCKGCQNPQTWPSMSGILFDDAAREELFRKLEPDYIKGVTFSGGDPMNPLNRPKIWKLATEIRFYYPDKDIWLYTGYTWEELIRSSTASMVLKQLDVLVDGRFDEYLADINYPWAGSINQRVIDVQASLKLEVEANRNGVVVLYKNK